MAEPVILPASAAGSNLTGGGFAPSALAEQRASAERRESEAAAGHGKGGGPAAGAAAVGGAEGEALRRLLRRLHLLSTYAENVRLSFQVHEGTGRMMLRVLDAETGEVLKEVPPEDYLDAMGRIAGFVGALLDRRV